MVRKLNLVQSVAQAQDLDSRVSSRFVMNTTIGARTSS